MHHGRGHTHTGAASSSPAEGAASICLLEKFVVEIRAIMAGPAHGGGAVCQLGRGR